MVRRTEKSEISSIYAMQAGTGGLPSNYFGGVFWWYAAEEIDPDGRVLSGRP